MRWGVRFEMSVVSYFMFFFFKVYNFYGIFLLLLK